MLYSTQRHLQSELCVRWASCKRFLVKGALPPKSLLLKLGRMKRFWVLFFRIRIELTANGKPVRLMRILTSTGILRALGNNVFAHTPLSLAYLDTPEVEFWDLWQVQPQAEPNKTLTFYPALTRLLQSRTKCQNMLQLTNPTPFSIQSSRRSRGVTMPKEPLSMNFSCLIQID